MLSISSKNTFYELCTMMTESEIGLVPRVIMVNSSNNSWRQEITKAIDLDRNIFKGSNFVLTCKRHLNGKCEEFKFKGDLDLSLHNVLASVKSNDNMLITVENIVTSFIKGRKIEKTVKLIYIVFQI
jgi:hypothetical protein